MEQISKDTLLELMPKKLKSFITDEVVDNINNISSDPDFAKFYRENLITYTTCIKEGVFSVSDYVSAIKYITYKVLGDTNKDAYIKTFPDRFKSMREKEYSDKAMNASITAYNKGKLVSLLMERTIIPMHIYGRDLHIDALNRNADLMYNAKSESVQQKASVAILEYTQPPEESKIEIDMTIKDRENVVDEYENALRTLAQGQGKLIVDGGDVKAIANIKIRRDESIEAEIAETKKTNSN